MSEIKIGIPLGGKMATRVLHQPSFRARLANSGFKPVYFMWSQYFRSFDFDPEQYRELRVEEYDKYDQKRRLLRTMKKLRRFVIITETTDLRFREEVESILYDSPASQVGSYIFFTDFLRRIPNMGKFLLWLESTRESGLKCALTPGIGNYGFGHAGNFAREAQKQNLPVFASITNYDNIVNMGYRGYTPTCLAVWSQQMADEAIRLHGIPASKIEVTGPLQYDRFIQPLPIGRDEFLKSIDLDPAKKTIFFAGGVNITRYFEIYKLFIEQKSRVSSEPFNFVVRPYPHGKLLGSPGWQALEKLFRQEGVYLSNPGSIEAAGDRRNEYQMDLNFDEGPDELAYLLHYSDVMINYFSTISLEAAICDLPVIHLGDIRIFTETDAQP
ncbi:MAG: hypothetical protein HUU12_13460 [Anaerolineales bacterium]|nr:hypothetical protein [Anaerolineales bacterium]